MQNVPIWEILSFFFGSIFTFLYHLYDRKNERKRNRNELVDLICQLLKDIAVKTVDNQYNPDLRIDYTLLSCELRNLSKKFKNHNFNKMFEDELSDIHYFSTTHEASKDKVSIAVQKIIRTLLTFKQ